MSNADQLAALRAKRIAQERLPPVEAWPDDALLTPSQAEAYLGIPTGALLRAARRGAPVVAPTLVGGTIRRYRADAVRAALRALDVAP